MPSEAVHGVHEQPARDVFLHERAVFRRRSRQSGHADATREPQLRRVLPVQPPLRGHPAPPSRPVRPERRAGRLLRGHPEAGHHVVAVRPGEEGLRIEAQGVTERQRHILTGL